MVKHNAKGVRIAAALLLVFLFQQICSKAGSFAADIFDYSSIDTHNVFAWISVHHIVQTLLALVPVAVLSKTYGINLASIWAIKKQV